jgi:anti-anti-sigma regulatory factor
MTSKEPVVVKQLPERGNGLRHRSFLSEVSSLADRAYRPRLVLDMSTAKKIGPDSIDLLLDCVEEIQHADGRVAVAGAGPEATVILELTRLTSVLDVFPSVSEAVRCEIVPSISSPNRSDTLSLAA